MKTEREKQQRDALEALDDVIDCLSMDAWEGEIEGYGHCKNGPQILMEKLQLVRHALTNPAVPTAPDAVRRLPDKWRMEGIVVNGPTNEYDAGYRAAKVEDADELDRAIAQSGEGRVPEGYRPLTRDEALLELWQAINHPWGKTTDDKVILQRLHESGVVLAAPEPGPENGD